MLASLDAVEGARVLDLFAGSGALGIEALSRGAATATFVDDDPRAVDAIRQNLASLGLGSDRVAVVRDDALRHAGRAAFAGLVLADPPYRFDRWVELFALLRGRAGLVVAEAGAEPDTGPGWETVKVKRYGGTVVVVVQPAAGSQDPAQQEGEC